MQGGARMQVQRCCTGRGVGHGMNWMHGCVELGQFERRHLPSGMGRQTWAVWEPACCSDASVGLLHPADAALRLRRNPKLPADGIKHDQLVQACRQTGWQGEGRHSGCLGLASTQEVLGKHARHVSAQALPVATALGRKWCAAVSGSESSQRAGRTHRACRGPGRRGPTGRPRSAAAPRAAPPHPPTAT